MGNYSLEAAAKYLCISTRTLRRWEQQGKLVPLYNSNNIRYYTEEMLHDFENGSFSSENIDKYKKCITKPISILVNKEKLSRVEIVSAENTSYFALDGAIDVMFSNPATLLRVIDMDYGLLYTIGVFKGNDFEEFVSWKEIDI